MILMAGKFVIRKKWMGRVLTCRQNGVKWKRAYAANEELGKMKGVGKKKWHNEICKEGLKRKSKRILKELVTNNEVNRK